MFFTIIKEQRSLKSGRLQFPRPSLQPLRISHVEFKNVYVGIYCASILHGWVHLVMEMWNSTNLCDITVCANFDFLSNLLQWCNNDFLLWSTLLVGVTVGERFLVYCLWPIIGKLCTAFIGISVCFQLWKNIESIILGRFAVSLSHKPKI